MEKIKSYLKSKYNLSSYQIAQIIFLFKTIGSELSKIIIMGILFHDHILHYLFALFVMLFLRSTTGGLHFYTYLGCLLTSTLYLGISLYVLPNIVLPVYIQLILLLLCILLCNYVGPITSKYRPKECLKHFTKFKKIITVFIFIYALILYIIPENTYITAGFWVIILHSLQLLLAKIPKKGEQTKHG